MTTRDAGPHTGDAAPGTSRPPTIQDVARLVGVSTGTVSHVLNGSHPVRPETRRRVEDARLITAVRGYYDSDALVIAQTAKELAEFGIEPRHLRGMKAAADREVGLVQQIVAPQLRTNDPAARARAEETAAEVAALSVRLHATLIKAGLKRP